MKARKKRGFALITSVMVGAILVIIVAAGMAYLLGSSRMVTADRISDDADEAARGCLAWAIAKFDSASPDAVATTSMTFDKALCDVKATDAGDAGFVLEAKGWLPQSKTTPRILRVTIQPKNPLQYYAVAAGGDIRLRNHSFVASLPEKGKGDLRSNGSISAIKNSSAHGSATAVGTITADSKSHFWQGMNPGAPSFKMPKLSAAQIEDLHDQAEEVKSTQIPVTSLGAGELAGYYYSFANYDHLVSVSNGLTLKLDDHKDFTLNGTMFVSGKLLIENTVRITGEGRIIATEGITFRHHSQIIGTNMTSHTDVVSLYGDILVRRHSVLGKVHTSFKGRDKDKDDGNDNDDDDGQKSDDDDHFKRERDALLPWSNWFVMAGRALDAMLMPPAYADKDKADKDKSDKNDKNKNREHTKNWKKKYKGVIPVGCTLWAMTGNVKLSKHTTLLGNIMAGGWVEVWNRSDVIRNTDDPVDSVAIFGWQSTTVQTVK